MCKECYAQTFTALLRSQPSLIRRVQTHPKKLYQSPDDWFFKIIAELRSADLLLLLQTWEGEAWTKQMDARSLRSLTGKIDYGIRLENPVDPELQPNLWNLVQCAIELSSRSQDWYESFLRGKKAGEPGFIYCHRSFIKSLETKNFKKIDSKENVSKNTKPRKPYTARVTEGNLQKLVSDETVQWFCTSRRGGNLKQEPRAATNRAGFKRESRNDSQTKTNRTFGTGSFRDDNR